jgi:hypothetical protein
VGTPHQVPVGRPALPWRTECRIIRAAIDGGFPKSMLIDSMRKLAISILKNYRSAWLLHAALETFLDNYPMPDGTKGIPEWRQIVKEWTADPEGQARADERFAPLFAQIQSAQTESEVADILKEFERNIPTPSGWVN